MEKTFGLSNFQLHNFNSLFLSQLILLLLLVGAIMCFVISRANQGFG